MSYAGIRTQTTRYREMQVLAATPGDLVVMIYDHLLGQLQRARMATDITARSDALEKARAALAELLVTLDQEKGGPMAVHLAAIYSFLLGECSTLGVRPDAARFERLARIVRNLRDAFAEAAAAHATPAVAGLHA